MPDQSVASNSSRTIPWGPGPGLLVSARSLAESEMIINSGARWLDLKEPRSGSLGMPSLELIFAVLELDIPESMQVSVAGGELLRWSPDLDTSLAAKLPARTYLKVALANCRETPWQIAAERISRALVRRSQLILVHYADFQQANAPSWQEVIETAKSLGGKYVLIDTYGKQTGGLLDHYSLEQLDEMIEKAKKLKLGVALAGSLKLEQLKSLLHSNADWLGVRSAICHEAHRTGDICRDRLHQTIALFPAFSSIES